MVGAHLDQIQPFDISGHLRGGLFDRPLPLHVLVEPELCHVDDHNCLHRAELASGSGLNQPVAEQNLNQMYISISYY